MWPVFCLHPHPSVSSRPPLETTVEILPLKKKASDVSENHKHSHKSTHTVWNVISVGKLSLSTTILVEKNKNKKRFCIIRLVHQLKIHIFFICILHIYCLLQQRIKDLYRADPSHRWQQHPLCKYSTYKWNLHKHDGGIKRVIRVSVS